MPTTYSKAAADVLSIVKSTTSKFHGEVEKAGVTIDVLMAYNPDGHAVTHGGYPAQAKVKIVSLKDRAKGCKDAEIIIDDRNWDKLSDAERKALIDHELEHLEVQYEEGEVKIDDLGRPKLKIKKHDWQMGWFDVIARRHGESSPEVRQASELMAKNGQLYFGFAADDGGFAAKAVSGLADVVGKHGVESLTIETGGKSVTIDAAAAKKIKAAAKA